MNRKGNKMTKPLSHPLKLSLSYVKIKDRRRKPGDTMPETTRKPLSEKELSEKYNLASSYFYRYTHPKRLRTFRLLGRGNVEAGYLKYLILSKEVEERLLEISKDMVPRKKALSFSKFIGKSPSFFSGFSKDIKTDGIRNATKLATCRKIIKKYERFERINI